MPKPLLPIFHAHLSFPKQDSLHILIHHLHPLSSTASIRSTSTPANPSFMALCRCWQLLSATTRTHLHQGSRNSLLTFSIGNYWPLRRKIPHFEAVCIPRVYACHSSGTSALKNESHQMPVIRATCQWRRGCWSQASWGLLANSRKVAPNLINPHTQPEQSSAPGTWE